MVIRLHRWVVWWFVLGVVGGVVALGNIFLLDLTRLDERVILLVGLVHWLLGGLACWAWEGVKLETGKPVQHAAGKSTRDVLQDPQQALASELMAHQNRPMSPRHSRLRQETVTVYLLRHGEHKRERQS